MKSKQVKIPVEDRAGVQGIIMTATNLLYLPLNGFYLLLPSSNLVYLFGYSVNTVIGVVFIVLMVKFKARNGAQTAGIEDFRVEKEREQLLSKEKE